jgi:hypothetical protein
MENEEIKTEGTMPEETMVEENAVIADEESKSETEEAPAPEVSA